MPSTVYIYGRFEKYIGDKEYLTGSLTFADFIMADFLDVLERMDPGLIKDHFPKLFKLLEKVWAIPTLAKYKESKFKPFPSNGPAAIWGNK